MEATIGEKEKTKTQNKAKEMKEDEKAMKIGTPKPGKTEENKENHIETRFAAVLTRISVRQSVGKLVIRSTCKSQVLKYCHTFEDLTKLTIIIQRLDDVCHVFCAQLGCSQSSQYSNNRHCRGPIDSEQL
jgi:hypothetical protein